MLISIIFHTPIWVWFVFIYLLRIGFQGLSDQPIHIQKTGVLTISFFIFSLVKIQGTHLSIFIWLIGLIIGFVVGYFLFSTQIKNSYRGTDQQIYLPGKKNLLVFLVTIFVLHYIITVLINIRPSPLWEVVNIIFSGLTNGILSYRAIKMFRQYNSFIPIEKETSRPIH
ncbi:DUF6622 family protein [Vibrio viridaestus]|uniref:DUF1453 family protein n=1 Tax=Vibrio viridaestus TaxID=2487322 RepID=A0A3N9TCH3_9VIBR|nr:DUF1453 family protein [Vibrio viridaestus]